MHNSELFFLSLMLISPMIAIIMPYIFKTNQRIDFTTPISFLMSTSLIAGIFLFYFSTKNTLSAITEVLTLSPLNLVLCLLVTLVSFIVLRFSIRYLNGDTHYHRYFFFLVAITVSCQWMALVNNLFLFCLFWSLSNFILVGLMIHKSQWQAAKNSGLLTLKTLFIGNISLFIAALLLYQTFQTTSLQMIFSQQPQNKWLVYSAMSFIVLTAITQSAIWPFHRWLISSLNSPTPVSALMHAGLVNGGGILIVKFAPLFIIYPNLLMVIFILGSVSALLGSVWKLIQVDIKRMLACSTMAQMGFMMMQCGLGLFAAAIAHLFWHGLFKAYLFLNSGSAIAQTKQPVTDKKFSFIQRAIAAFGGLITVYGFAWITNKPLVSLETTTLLLVFVFMAGTQLMLSLIQPIQTWIGYLTGLGFAALAGMLYGLSIKLIESILSLSIPIIEIHSIHVLVVGIFFCLWAGFNLGWFKTIQKSQLWCRLYMRFLNHSQPSAQTMTPIRRDYQY